MTMADLLSKYLCHDSVLECHDIDATLMSSIFVGTLLRHNCLFVLKFSFENFVATKFSYVATKI